MTIRSLAVALLLICLTFVTSVRAVQEPVRFDGKSVTLHKKLTILPDTDGYLTIKDVSSPDAAHRFVPGSEFAGKTLHPGAYWLRFELINPDREARNIVVFPLGPWNEIRLYVAQGSGHSMRRSGLLVPLSERDLEVNRLVQFGAPYSPVSATLPGSSNTTLYLRLASDWRYGSLDYFAVEVDDLAKIISEERTIRLVEGVFIGIFIALGLYHLLLMAALRDASYGFYVLHIFGMALVSTQFYGFPREYLWPERPVWNIEAFNLWRMFAIVGLAQFTRIFLNTRKSNAHLNVALLVVMGGSVLTMAAIPFASFTFIVEAMGLWFLAMFIVAFWTGVLAQIAGNPLARYFLAGNVFTLLGIAIAIMGEYGLLESIAWSNFGPQIGTTLEALMLSQGLAYRVNLMRAEILNNRLAEERVRREHEEAQRSFLERQKLELEQKVVARTAELSTERERSESLLRNILPTTIAEELKQFGKISPKRHDEVSILFTDFANFTQTVATIPPQRMVEELNEIFLGFDEIVERHGLEKIKTIGDAYLAAAGVPEPLPDAAAHCVRAALDMQHWIANRNLSSSIKWGLRIGIHSGPVVAGVVGSKKYAYDIWGDTVNIASRMESAGEVGRVNISAYTHDLIRAHFDCEYRGKIAAKGKGDIDMYFVLCESGLDDPVQLVDET